MLASETYLVTMLIMEPSTMRFGQFFVWLTIASNLQKRNNFSIMAPSLSFEKIKDIG